MIIRPEKIDDYLAIRQVNVEAFAHHPFSHQTEHLIVEALRAEGALTISFVAVSEGEVVGHIAFSPITINGKNVQWFALGPVAVMPAMQKKGIGSALVNQGLRSLRLLGAQGCVLVGDPSYYSRFGFRHNAAMTMDNVPPEVLLIFPFTENLPCGKVELHSAFWVQAT